MTFAKEETLLGSHLVIRDSAISMFSSIRDSEKVRLGEAGGIIAVLEGEGEGDLKNTFLRMRMRMRMRERERASVKKLELFVLVFDGESW